MRCSNPLNPACVARSVTGHAAHAVAGSVVSGIAHEVQSGVAWVVSTTVDWWVQVPSPNLAAEPTVGALQDWLLPVTVAVAVMAMLFAAGKIALTRKANPLVDVGYGLAIVAATSALGVLLPSMLVKAGDAWSSWVLTEATGGHFGSRLTAVLILQGASSAVVIVLGVVAIVMGAIQAVLMLFRQAALVVLAGVLPLAAAGALAPATRPWFRRVTGWMLALIFYKPAAAAVYAAAFALLGRGKDPRTVLMGFAMVLLSLVALPALMKFFTWTTGSVETAAGGGLLGTVLSGAIAIGAVRGSSFGGAGSLPAADQARLLAGQLGPADAPGPPGGGPQGAARTEAGPFGVQTGPTAGTGVSQSGAGPAAGAGMGSAATGPGAAAAGAEGAAAASGAAAGTGAVVGAAAAAAGPAGVAAAVVAEGAARAGRSVAEAMQPPGTEN